MKPSIPKGTRDFSPQEMVKRNYIFDTIRGVFHLFGFQQIETPAIENLSTLMGKYGEEGDRLLFKILNSGDFIGKISDEELLEKNSLRLTPKISEKGLRYDLTVPFARFVVQHRDEITFPFKRFQIQPVWRADRPQKGRYREFFQCDADIVGSDSLVNEVELLRMVDEVFARLNIGVLIKLNNRKILSGIADFIGASENLTDITVAIDKIDKIGLENVNAELSAKGVSLAAIEKLQPILLLKGDNAQKINSLREILKSSAEGLRGLEEVETILKSFKKTPLRAGLELDLTLARGLNYYTGAIVEVKATEVEIGSISGGGRYDNLTGVFGLNGVSGVGVSFGADRIYDVLNALGRYPAQNTQRTFLMFAPMGENELAQSLENVLEVRKNGINAEVYPETAKLKKQMTYAERAGIPFVAIVGEEELKQGKVMLKNMTSGEQELLTLNQVIEKIKTF